MLPVEQDIEHLVGVVARHPLSEQRRTAIITRLRAGDRRTLRRWCSTTWRVDDATPDECAAAHRLGLLLCVLSSKGLQRLLDTYRDAIAEKEGCA